MMRVLPTLTNVPVVFSLHTCSSGYSVADELNCATNVHLTTDPLLVNVMPGMISCAPYQYVKNPSRSALSANSSLVINPSVQFSALPPERNDNHIITWGDGILA